MPKHGHVDGVNALAISPCGTYLASAGNDQFLIIWSMHTGRLLHKICLDSPVVSVCWRGRNSVFFGCDDGKIELIEDLTVRYAGRRKKVHIGVDAPVYALDYDMQRDRLAVGVGSEVQVASRLSPQSYATSVIMPEPLVDLPGDSDHRLRPRSVHFLPQGSQLIVTYLNHGIICWDIATRTNLWEMGTNRPDILRPIGSSALSPDHSCLLVHNVDGMGLFRMGISKPTQSYTHPADIVEIYPVKLSFLKGGRQVTCGSPSGCLHIWDTSTAAIEQTLDHEGHSVQAICGYEAVQYNFLVAASSGTGEDTFIRVWLSGHFQDRGNTMQVYVDSFRRFFGLNSKKGYDSLVIAVGSLSLVLVASVFLRYYPTPLDQQEAGRLLLTPLVAGFMSVSSWAGRILKEFYMTCWDAVKVALRYVLVAAKVWLRDTGQ